MTRSLDDYLDKRLEKLIGVFTISVLFSKFLGDLAAYALTQRYGMYVGLGIGVVISTVLLVVWPLIDPDDPGVQ